MRDVIFLPRHFTVVNQRFGGLPPPIGLECCEPARQKNPVSFQSIINSFSRCNDQAVPRIFLSTTRNSFILFYPGEHDGDAKNDSRLTAFIGERFCERGFFCSKDHFGHGCTSPHQLSPWAHSCRKHHFGSNSTGPGLCIWVVWSDPVCPTPHPCRSCALGTASEDANICYSGIFTYLTDSWRNAFTNNHIFACFQIYKSSISNKSGSGLLLSTEELNSRNILS